MKAIKVVDDDDVLPPWIQSEETRFCLDHSINRTVKNLLKFHLQLISPLAFVSGVNFSDGREKAATEAF